MQPSSTISEQKQKHLQPTSRWINGSTSQRKNIYFEFRSNRLFKVYRHIEKASHLTVQSSIQCCNLECETILFPSLFTQIIHNYESAFNQSERSRPFIFNILYPSSSGQKKYLLQWFLFHVILIFSSLGFSCISSFPSQSPAGSDSAPPSFHLLCGRDG